MLNYVVEGYMWWSGSPVKGECSETQIADLMFTLCWEEFSIVVPYFDSPTLDIAYSAAARVFIPSASFFMIHNKYGPNRKGLLNNAAGKKDGLIKEILPLNAGSIKNSQWLTQLVSSYSKVKKCWMD